MPTIHTGPLTRPPTSAESRTFERWRTAMKRGRRSVESLLAGAHCVSLAEQWRRIYAPSVPVVFSRADAEKIENLVSRWNTLEAALANVELERAAVRLNGPDLDVYDLPRPVEPGGAAGLGALPLVLLVVGIALIVGAIVATNVAEVEVKRTDADLKKRLVDLSAQMARGTPDQRSAWKSFLDSDPFKPEKTIWDKLSDTLSSGAGLGLLVLAGMLLMRGSSGGARTSEPIANPRRRRRRIAKPQHARG